MIKIIVVDDEKQIREGIARYINKNIEGFEVEQCFRDGDEAIEFLAENDIDIVISDVRMTRISGIELASFVYENKPYIKMIILSGYRDFEYAQFAIRYGVKAYLLKPTDFDELNSMLVNCREEIMHERDYIGNFMDSAKNMFAMLVKPDVEGGIALMEEIFTAAAGHDHQWTTNYIRSFFEILRDKLLANLKIDIASRGVSTEISAQSREELYEQSMRLIKSIFALLKKSDDNENTILDRAKRYIDEHYTTNISLQDVADCVYLNPIYFSRFFKLHTGQNFSEYLLNKRMKRAAELLKKNMKITDVSEACGYNNLGYFSRAFKEYYKCTPKEYVRISDGGEPM